MSFWAGFAQAYKDADDQRFKEKLLTEERAWETEQEASRRKYDREEWTRRFQMEQAAAERELFLSTTLAGGLSGGGGGRRSGGASAQDVMSFEAFVQANPELDDEALAQLANYPDKLYEINEIITKARTSAAANRQVISPEQFNGLIVDIIPDDPTEKITGDMIRERASFYGIDLGDTNVDLMADLMGNQTEAPEVVLNPAAITPRDRASEKQLQDLIKGDLTGSLKDQERLLRIEISNGNNSEEVLRKLKETQDLIAVVDTGNLRPVLNTPQGTDLMIEYASNGYDVSGLFVGFTPTFSNEEQIAAALSAGLIDYGSRIRFLQPDGTFKEVVVRQ